MNLTIFFNPELDFLQVPYHRMPTLEKMIGMGSVTYLAKSSELLMAEHVLQQSLMTCPSAVLQRLAEGLPIEGNWLLASPVHLLLQRDTFSLLHPSEVAASQGELRALVQTLNQHFSEDGVCFELSAAGYCYLSLPMDTDFMTSSPYLAANQKIDKYLPSGQGGALINRMMNEIQMLLFDHPVNRERELNGKLTINGFWLYGEGCNAESDSEVFLAGGHPLLIGLAKTTNNEVHTIGQFSELAEPAKKGIKLDNLVVLDQLELLEEAWLQPALKALRLFQLSSLQIVFTVGGRSIKLGLNGPASWKLWVKPKNLEQIISHD